MSAHHVSSPLVQTPAAPRPTAWAHTGVVVTLGASSTVLGAARLGLLLHRRPRRRGVRARPVEAGNRLRGICRRNSRPGFAVAGAGLARGGPDRPPRGFRRISRRGGRAGHRRRQPVPATAAASVSGSGPPRRSRPTARRRRPAASTEQRRAARCPPSRTRGRRACEEHGHVLDPLKPRWWSTQPGRVTRSAAGSTPRTGGRSPSAAARCPHRRHQLGRRDRHHRGVPDADQKPGEDASDETLSTSSTSTSSISTSSTSTPVDLHVVAPPAHRPATTAWTTAWVPASEQHHAPAHS